MIKRFLTAVAVAVLFFSCADNEENDAPPVNPSSDKPVLRANVIGGMEDIAAEASDGSVTSIDLYMAVGETESIQVRIFGHDNEPLRFKWDAKHPEVKVDCYRFEDYGGHERDVLVPCSEVYPDYTSEARVWLNVSTSVKAKTNSKYTESIAFESTTGRCFIKVTVHTGSVEIPEVPTIPSVFGIYTENASDKKAYSDFLLGHRISPYFFDGWGSDGHSINCTSSPYDFDTPEFWEYLKDKRFSAICLPFYHLSESELENEIARARSEGIWDKCYYYLYDEPSTQAQFEKIAASAGALHGIDPDARVMTTFYREPQDGPDAGHGILATFDHLDLGRSDIYCVVNDDEGVAAEAYKSRLRDNQQFWCYVSGFNHPGITCLNFVWEQRAIMWRYWLEDATGFLYWAVNWYEHESPLEPRIGTKHNDGQIVFPGKAFGAEGICPSIRLERFRDSLEDCEMLKIYERDHSRAEALELLKGMYDAPHTICRSLPAIDEFHKKLTGN